MPIDKKYQFLAVNTDSGKTFTEEDGVVFLAKDDAFPRTLIFYLDECARLGAHEPQLEGIRNLYARVIAWRNKYPELCKVPDTPARGEEGG